MDCSIYYAIEVTGRPGVIDSVQLVLTLRSAETSRDLVAHRSDVIRPTKVYFSTVPTVGLAPLCSGLVGVQHIHFNLVAPERWGSIFSITFELILQNGSSPLVVKLLSRECHRTSLIKTGSGNGLLPDGTEPLPEPRLTKIAGAILHQ